MNIAMSVRGVLAVMLCMVLSSACAFGRAISLQDAIESPRVMQAGERSAPFVFSPDGAQYVLLVLQSNVHLNRVEASLLVGSLSTIDDARPRAVARLHTSGLGPTAAGQQDMTRIVSNNAPRWIDAHRVALLWQDNREVAQVIAINVETGHIEYLTAHPTDVDDFAVGPRGDVLYRAAVATPDAGGDEAYAVTAQEAWLFMAGLPAANQLDLARWERRWFVAAHGSTEPRLVQEAYGRRSIRGPIVFSHDGERALILTTARAIPQDWSQYSLEFLSDYIRSAIEQPQSENAGRVQQLSIADINKGSARALWNAPAPLGGYYQAAWSPDDRYIVVGPTPLPRPSVQQESAGAVVDVMTGHFTPLDIPSTRANPIRGFRWLATSRIEVELADGECVHFVRTGSRWVRGPELQEEMRQGAHSIRLEWRQDLNTPPQLIATDSSSGERSQVLALDPRLGNELDLARVEAIYWDDEDGRQWRGILYYPLSYSDRKRYPLVIQTNVSTANDFTLFGRPHLGFTALIAQPLAGRDIAVLQAAIPVMPLEAGGNEYESNTPYFSAYEAAARHLIATGLADPDRIGIAGFSNRGWHVEQVLAFSDFPFAAAVASDNINGGYLQGAFSNWRWSLTSDLNGAEPFGEGLGDWLGHSPALNAEHIRTPLMLQVTDSYLGYAAPMASWETFSRLRHLNHPVELFIGANIARGAHNLQNPGQALALQQRTLDWWLFWLKDEEDAAPEKRSQYAMWRALRSQRDTLLRQPRPPRLMWSARPHEPAFPTQ